MLSQSASSAGDALGGGPGKHKRPTIGLLLGILGESYQGAIWPAVVDVAREQDVNLLCFAGGSLRAPTGFAAQSNVIYDLVSPHVVDGLVIMAGSIGLCISIEETSQFCQRYRPLPIVSIALQLEGIPSVLVDNYRGMRGVVTHMIEAHGYRRIAFVRGPAGHREADERFRAYADVLGEHGLRLDAKLVAPGTFGRDSGVEAIRLLCDERNVDLEAVVVANDAMALGVLEALQARGVRVPYDVAIVGFDDVEEARFATPPLTTVHQPLYLQGRRAAEMLLAQLRGEPCPPQVVLPMDLVVRQSCGCFPVEVSGAGAGPGTAAQQTIAGILAEQWNEEALAELVQAAPVVPSGYQGPAAPAWTERLLNAFALELTGKVSEAFLPALDDVLRRVMAQGGDVGPWQRVLSTMRRQLLPGLSGESLAQAEDLWQQARVLVGEMAQRAQARQRLRSEQQAQTLRDIDTALSTTISLPELKDEITRQLPRAGIDRCYISLYEEGAQSATSRLILAYQEDGRIELEEDGLPFLSGDLVPAGLLAQDRRRVLAVQPLYFRDTSMGFALFEMGPRDGIIYGALQEQISSALRGALLSRERERLLSSLAGRALQLQTAAEVARAASSILDPDDLIQQVVELVGQRFSLYYAGLFLVDPTGHWAVLRAGMGAVGRQMVERGYRLEVGSASMVGWCAANKQTRIALNVDEDPVHLQHPLLPETRSEMALPIKVGERLIGVLDVQRQQSNAFADDDVTVFQTMADQLGVAIENARVVAEMRLLNQDLQETLDTQRGLLETIRELSTPVVPLVRGIILLPLVGNIDTARSQQVMEQLLDGVQVHRAQVAIVDITGVAVVDTGVAHGLIRAAQAVSLLGAEVVLVGIRPEVAQTMVTLGVDLSGIVTHSNLQNGISYALWRMGFMIAPS